MNFERKENNRIFKDDPSSVFTTKSINPKSQNKCLQPFALNPNDLVELQIDIRCCAYENSERSDQTISQIKRQFIDVSHMRFRKSIAILNIFTQLNDCDESRLDDISNSMPLWVAKINRVWRRVFPPRQSNGHARIKIPERFCSVAAAAAAKKYYFVV